MLSFFRRKPTPQALTFNERAETFWKWFQEVAPRFYNAIEAGQCASLADETDTRVKELLGNFAWVYGPGKDGVGHSFTVTGEGNIHKQLLTRHWLGMAPRIEGWTFFAERQSGPIKGHVIEMFDLRFDPKEIWVTPNVDAESKRMDLTVWHPAWDHLEDTQKYGVTFLFLDEALGEFGTEWWIRAINFTRDQLSGSFPLAELPEFVAKTAAERDWKKYPPGESWSLLRVDENDGMFPRSDIRTISTSVVSLQGEYFDSCGEFKDPLSGTGAEYVYVSILRDFFPKGCEVDRRGLIEDAIERELGAIRGGRLVGGGFGAEHAYIDMLIFDGERSIDAIKRALIEQRVPHGTMIEFFARESRQRRIAM